MSDRGKSVKHLLISKNNTTMLVALGIAGAVLSFTLVTGTQLIKRMNYQSKVIEKREDADKQLKDNVVALDSLIEAYKTFDSAKESVIGTQDANSKIVLDALPSKYDFPAVATTIEKLLIRGGFTDIMITGSDNEAEAEQNSASPSPIEIPFSFSGKGSYAAMKTLMTKLHSSIRPLKVQKMDITADQGTLTLTVSGVTYYQPEKSLEITLEDVK